MLIFFLPVGDLAKVASPNYRLICLCSTTFLKFQTPEDSGFKSGHTKVWLITLAYMHSPLTNSTKLTPS